MSAGVQFPIQVNVYKSYLPVDVQAKIGLLIFSIVSGFIEIVKVSY